MIDITSSFEQPADAEWEYENHPCVSNLMIDSSTFDTFADSPLLYPQLQEWITCYNNKVGSLRVTYVLCRHYYDLGIPDEPWYTSSSHEANEQVQYFPHFNEEHYTRLFWFNYFAESLYVESLGIWDNIIELINFFFDIDAPSNTQKRHKVVSWLKKNNQDLSDVVNSFFSNECYIKANQYRIDFVHGNSPCQITNQYKYERNITARVLDCRSSCMAGHAVYKEVSHANVLRCSIGNYTSVREVLETFEAFSALSADTISRIIELIVS